MSEKEEGRKLTWLFKLRNMKILPLDYFPFSQQPASDFMHAS